MKCATKYRIKSWVWNHEDGYEPELEDFSDKAKATAEFRRRKISGDIPQIELFLRGNRSI